MAAACKTALGDNLHCGLQSISREYARLCTALGMVDTLHHVLHNHSLLRGTFRAELCAFKQIYPELGPSRYRWWVCGRAAHMTF